MASSPSSSSAAACSIFLFLIFFFFVSVPRTVNAYGEYVLYSDAGQAMLPGQNFTYDLTHSLFPFGPFHLVFQLDCNLVRYTHGVKTWESNTTRPSPHNCSLSLLPDGEVGLNTYYPYGKLVTYRNFRLVLRNDCNLVLEDMNTWDVLWETKTSSDYGDCFTILDDYGELFIKHNRRDVLWRTGVRAEKQAVYPNSYALVLRYDGRLMIYDQKIWDIPVPTMLPFAAS